MIKQNHLWHGKRKSVGIITAILFKTSPKVDNPHWLLLHCVNTCCNILSPSCKCDPTTFTTMCSPQGVDLRMDMLVSLFTGILEVVTPSLVVIYSWYRLFYYSTLICSKKQKVASHSVKRCKICCKIQILLKGIHLHVFR